MSQDGLAPRATPCQGWGSRWATRGCTPPGELGVGVLLHAGTTTGDWEGLIPVGTGQWGSAWGCWPGDTHHCVAAFRVQPDSDRSGAA